MTSSPATSVMLPRLRRLAGPLLAAGGLLWALTFACIIVNGLLTGTLPNVPDAEAPLFLRVAIRLFALSVVVLGLGLWALAPRLRSRGLVIAGLIFTTVAMAFAATNLITLSGLTGTPSYSDTLGGLSVMITSVATLLVGIATIRTGGFPRPLVVALLCVGLTTIPVLIFTPLPVGPDWATDFLAFLTSGVAYMVAGALLWSRGGEPLAVAEGLVAAPAR